MADQTRSYTDEFRAQAIKLAAELGQKKAALELGIPKGTMSTWIARARQGGIDPGQGNQTPETALTIAAELKAARERNKVLEKEIAELRRERAILEDATRFFARSQRH